MNTNNSRLLLGMGNLERQARNRHRIKIAVLAVVGVNAALLLGALVQGCRQEQSSITPVTSSNSPSSELTANPAPEATNSMVVSSNPPAQLEANNSANTTPASTVEYTIAKGDTFSALAKKFHVSVKAIMRANPGVQSNHLHIGQKIQIPEQTSNSLPAQ